MSEHKHTPGPWEYIPDDGTGILPAVLSAHVNKGGNFYVCQCNVDADARLIAAAPDLLAACEQVLTCLEPVLSEDQTAYCFQFPANGETANKLRAAVAKAKGEDR